MPPPVIRQPVLPELLVACRGHVLVPALGMTFIGKGAEAPPSGNFLREESLTPPYRVLTPGARIDPCNADNNHNSHTALRSSRTSACWDDRLVLGCNAPHLPPLPSKA